MRRRSPSVLPAGNSSTTIDALPDEVLGRILTLVWTWPEGGRSNSNAAAVCRRWRRVFMSEPGIWGTVGVTVPNKEGVRGFEAESRLMRAVAGMVKVFGAYQREGPLGGTEEADRQLADTLRLLRPAVLAELDLTWPLTSLPLPAVGLLPSFTALRQLYLHTVRLPGAATAAALRSLTQLRELYCTTRFVPPVLVAALSALRTLRRLHLASPLLLPPGLREALAPLTHLECLVLLEERGDCFGMEYTPLEMETQYQQSRQWRLGALEPLEPPPLAGFPALQAYDISSNAGHAMRNVRFGPGIEVAYALYAVGGPPHRPGKASVLQVAPTASPCLSATLDALVPPSRQLPLESLIIQLDALSAAQVAGCARLAALRTLRFEGPGGTGAWQDAAQALLCQATALSELELHYCLFPDGRTPEWLRARRGLRTLHVRKCGVQELAAGPYLEGLEELNLLANPLPRLPPALAAATGLRRLHIGGPGEAMALGLADLEVLRQLPRLEALHTAALEQGSRLARALRRALPCLAVSAPEGPAMG